MFRLVKILFIGLLGIFGALAANAQGVRYDNVLLKSNGGFIPSATINVCTGTTSPLTVCTAGNASLFGDSALSIVLPNPVHSDAAGNYGFWAAEGNYTATVTATGIVTYSIAITLGSSNSAVKPAASDGTVFVSPNGSDATSQDCLSRGTACLTPLHAVAKVQALGASASGIIDFACNGNYTVPSTISNPAGNPTITLMSDCSTAGQISGVSHGATLTYTGTSGSLVQTGRIILRHLLLVGPGTGTSTTGVDCNNPATLYDVDISGFGNKSTSNAGFLQDTGCGLVQVDKFSIHDNGTDFYDSSSVGGAEGIHFSHGLFSDAAAVMNAAAIEIDGNGEDFWIDQSSLDSAGVTITGTGGSYAFLLTHFENASQSGVANSTTAPFITGSSAAMRLGLSDITFHVDTPGATSTMTADLIKVTSLTGPSGRVVMKNVLSGQTVSGVNDLINSTGGGNTGELILEGVDVSAGTIYAGTWGSVDDISAGGIKTNFLAANGTEATITGTGACGTITTQLGGAWAGTAKCTGSTAASTLTITPGTTAPNGWSCSVYDETTRANLFQQTSYTTAACVLTATSITQNDIFVFQAVAF